MPRKNMIFDVFIASPGDVVEERKIIKEVIDDINAIHSRYDGNSLNLLEFERNTYPNRGDYAQDVVTKQIGDYDIFIGILWTRLGEPTEEQLSGTVEEIEEAMCRYDKNKINNVSIYFSNVPKNNNDIDPNELKRLNDYKSKLMNGKSKQLCKEYDSLDEFRSVIRLNLEKMFKDAISKFEKSNLINDDININDLDNSIKDMINHFENSLKTVKDINSYVSKLNSKIKEEDLDSNEIVCDLEFLNNKLNSSNSNLRDKFFKGIQKFFNILINDNGIIIDDTNKDFMDIMSILWNLGRCIVSLLANLDDFERTLNFIVLDTKSSFAKENCNKMILKLRKNLYKINTPISTYLLFVDKELEYIMNKKY